MMNTVLEKLGIYDLIAVFLSGLTISTFTLIIARVVYCVEFQELSDLQFSETLSFLAICYFVGLVFQEIGSIIAKKLTQRHDRLLKSVLKAEAKSHFALTKVEIDKIFNYVNTSLCLDATHSDEAIVYNFCKYSVLSDDSAKSRIDKDQTNSAMSRSLSIYFFILFIVLLYRAITTNFIIVLLAIVSAVLSILLYYRCVRLAKLRYVNIFRTFLVNFISQKNV